MKIATWSIINNEIDYLEDIINFHVKFIDILYFLDTGSTDGSYELLKYLSSLYQNIIVERYYESFIPDYSVEWKEMKNPFPEIEVRNFALNQVKKLSADWLIQLDGDEIFLPKVRSVIEKSQKSIISHSTINPVEDLKKHPIELRNGVTLYDPHARIWKSNENVLYAQNPAMKRQFHCIPAQNGRHVYYSSNNEFVHDIFHFHLHWMYGKKMDCFFNKQGISLRKEMIKNQKINQYAAFVPKIFWDERKKWIENG